MVSSTLLARAVLEQVQSAESADELLTSFIRYLEQNHLVHLLPNIVRKMEAELARERKRNTIEIRTSHEFAPELIKNIQKCIEGGEADVFETVVDPSLIGGFVVTGKNKIRDASIRRNMHALRESLRQ